MTFRKDISGLRAIAVLAVMLFHFNPSWMPGGFVGVDVFFVISGFLMTGIIFTGLEQGNFSISKFYVARASRIIPALTALCAILLLLGAIFFAPLDFQALAKHVASSLGFISNLIYWKESGYFDSISYEKWLLHTWSLSTEWQFYIIYPLILIVMKRFMSVATMKLTILSLTLFGFLLCVYVTDKWPNPAYYLLPTRAWEMMLGGLAYLYPVRVGEKASKAMELSGVGFIVLSFLFISKENLWPGYLAILPTLGTVLVIQSHREHSIVTGNMIFQLLGKWSYSIYLWHWPIVLAIHHLSLGEGFVYLGIVLSIVLGFLSYRYIESISLKNEYPNFAHVIVSKPVLVTLTVGIVSSVVFLYYRGLIKSLPPVNQMADYRTGYCFGSPGVNKSDTSFLDCYLGDRSKPSRALLFGDSFAGQYEPMLDQIFADMSMSIHSITTNSCYPSLGEGFHHQDTHIGYKQCLMDRRFVSENIENYDVVFISRHWGEHFVDHRDSTSEVIHWIENVIGKGTMVFYLPSPNLYQENIGKAFLSSELGRYNFVPDFSLRNESIEYADIKEQQLIEHFKGTANFRFIHKDDLIKGHDFFYQGKKYPYSFDGEHISEFAARFAARDFRKTDHYHALLLALHSEY